jgi:hypothetical protein
MWICVRSCLFVFPLLLPACRSAPNHPEIRAVLDEQIVAWNGGDLDGFMRGYWKSDDVVFATPGGETRGWQQVIERYRRRYPDAAAMGHLSFDRITIARKGQTEAEACGVYRLERGEEKFSGRFFLTLRRIDGAWVIVRDYTVSDQ